MDKKYESDNNEKCFFFFFYIIRLAYTMYLLLWSLKLGAMKTNLKHRFKQLFTVFNNGLLLVINEDNFVRIIHKSFLQSFRDISYFR